MPRPTGFAVEATCWIRAGCKMALPTRAWHEAVLPPPEPAHVHIHGPAPVTADAVPALQRLVLGAVVIFVPVAEPHAPLTGVLCASAAPPAIATNNSRNSTLRINSIGFS